MSIMQMLDAEIEASIKNVKPVHVNLTKTADGIYKGHLPFKIEGDYILNSNTLSNQAIALEWSEKVLTVELESDEETISAFLSKDDSALLKAVRDSLKQEELSEEPAFIVGPPGTGKTTVITKILQEAIKARRRVLVLSPTNNAVENVFERITPEEMGLNDDQIVLTIKTGVESLKAYSPESVKQRALQPIQDELDILQMAKGEMLKTKRDAQPELTSLKVAKEAADTLANNLQRDINTIDQQLKKINGEISGVEIRIKALSGNKLLQSVAELFAGKKVEELEDEKARLSKKVLSCEDEKTSLSKKLKDALDDKTLRNKRFTSLAAEAFEAETALMKVQERINELNKQIDVLKTNNVFEKAMVTGATLVNAALNQKIQSQEYDMIIVDEASMALVPLLIAATQPLSKKALSSISYKEHKGLYHAQNKAVELALASKIVFVGDPRQLPPISKTVELQKSIFTVYGVEDIFNGVEVKNTAFLDTNFRNHPHITSLSSSLFYGGLLKSGKENDGKDSLFIRRSTSKMVPSESSYVNYGNMKIVIEQATKALERGRRSIGVITPYKKQAELINGSFENLRQAYPDADIQAGTVHTFQGKEKDIIIYDLTFSPSESNNFAIPATYNGDFNSNTAKLLNVATTRAESFFIIVGDIDGIANLPQEDLVLKEWVLAIKQADKN
ncbi:MAG: AAA domain-containing protein [Sulfurimonas sp.]|uniref:DEAD/DEAH box helicase n=1 Tax=Sulfurimonas sp. TaxID=2022749 RepID=UPI002620C940|nr:AAA domain-containing protein [Sulfurimonas sp.]MDD3476614.1 AAA domain-containing protein [Sulfurimonas sp.]